MNDPDQIERRNKPVSIRIRRYVTNSLNQSWNETHENLMIPGCIIEVFSLFDMNLTQSENR